MSANIYVYLVVLLLYLNKGEVFLNVLIILSARQRLSQKVDRQDNKDLFLT